MAAAEESQEAQISAVAALDEPTRRRLYEYVVRQPEPVSRDDAAAALGLPRTTAAFHLDRLVDEDLLDVSYQRRTGRTGPGAGRPAKLYRRSQQHVAVSLPQRRYDLAGRLLSSALEYAEHSGDSPRAILDQRASQLGKELGETTRSNAGNHDTRDTALRVLEEYGFEPRIEGDDIVLANCPFHTLAQTHTELVCGMNLSLLDGLLNGLADTGLTARLDPTPPNCCVRLSPGKRVGSDANLRDSNACPDSLPTNSSARR
jgi:predicted ArsR family transcriptional regulator